MRLAIRTVGNVSAAIGRDVFLDGRGQHICRAEVFAECGDVSCGVDRAERDHCAGAAQGSNLGRRHDISPLPLIVGQRNRRATVNIELNVAARLCRATQAAIGGCENGADGSRRCKGVDRKRLTIRGARVARCISGSDKWCVAAIRERVAQRNLPGTSCGVGRRGEIDNPVAIQINVDSAANFGYPGKRRRGVAGDVVIGRTTGVVSGIGKQLGTGYSQGGINRKGRSIDGGAVACGIAGGDDRRMLAVGQGIADSQLPLTINPRLGRVNFAVDFDVDRTICFRSPAQDWFCIPGQIVATGSAGIVGGIRRQATARRSNGTVEHEITVVAVRRDNGISRRISG